MKIKEPCIITSRLQAGVRVGNATISIDYDDTYDSNGRVVYAYAIDLDDGTEFGGNDLKSGCQGGTLQEGLKSLLVFLSSFGESWNYQERTGRDSEGTESFPSSLKEWAMENEEGLSMMAYDLENTEGIIDETLQGV